VQDRMEARGAAILLFAWHREVVEELSKKLARFPHAVVMGGTPLSERELAFSLFQAGGMNLIIGNIGAMGRGNNLQRATRVIFAEYSWTDELNKQCEKRASRRGNNQAFTPCDYLVAPGSFDEFMLQSVFKKAQKVKEVVG